MSTEYLNWLCECYPESGGQADLVAYFFRRAFLLLSQNGCLGLIATNTISQGDTRTASLQWICLQGGSIYNAQKRVRWPGLAAVVVSVIHIIKGESISPCFIDERKVNQITAFLFHVGSHTNPFELLANKGKTFKGTMVYGMGFTFDDSNTDATSIETMHQIIQKDSRSSELIQPYIGGEEVNSDPSHSYHRYVINFGEMSEDEARQYPELISIVEEKVKPSRLSQRRESRAKYWWRFGETTPALFKAITGLDKVLVVTRVSPHGAFTFLPGGMVYSDSLVVLALSKISAFSVLQSQIHGGWARFFSSSMKDDLRYTPSTCFETFPFPENWETDPTLEAVGKTYYEYRADLMVRNNQGVTDTYNRFHDPDERDPDLLKLRDLHEQCDRAVLNAYGWPDIDTTCGFALDYLDADPDDLPPDARDRIASGDLFFATPDEAAAFGALISSGKRKLPWRYRWPEATHDEVLARLLDLNQQRHEEEVLGGKQNRKPKKQTTKTKPTRSTTAKSNPNTPTIPGMDL